MPVEECLSENSQKVIEAYLSKHYRKQKALQHSRKPKVVAGGLSPWRKNYNQLCTLKEKQGDCRVCGHAKPALYAWVKRQRKAHRRGCLSAWKVKKLNLLAFDWDPLDNQWKGSFEKLKAYKQKNGHCIIFYNSELSAWTSRQRRGYKKGLLESWKIECLNELGFDWDPDTNQWKRRFEELRSHKQKHGDCTVPCKQTLSYWIRVQRSRYKKAKLESWKTDALNAFKQKALLRWQITQRIAYKKGKLESSRIELLNALGFDWDPFTHRWEQHFEKLQQYKEKHGSLHFIRERFLSLWATTQRRSYKKGSLESWKIERLNALSFDWSVRTQLGSPIK